ncbi:hypothetical protein Glove_396g51 [Diversispora epigaea]|uniref:Uncharacterized protein n=1 Tax=Diversispora epigaea TaxID=1348612 RepID=A0A397H2B2_9GLOM|nr:hypothetical protein Glove_396g51 [Diversispora epigaea]
MQENDNFEKEDDDQMDEYTKNTRNDLIEKRVNKNPRDYRRPNSITRIENLSYTFKFTTGFSSPYSSFSFNEHSKNCEKSFMISEAESNTSNESNMQLRPKLHVENSPLFSIITM